MNTTELHDLFRVEMHDVETPYLFGSTAIYTYIDDAQKQFCRLTEGIEDARSFTITIVPNVEWYDISPKILKLRTARVASSGAVIAVVNQERAAQAGVRFDGRIGPVRHLVAGAEKNALRANPVPRTDSPEGLVNLEVFRLPETVGEDEELEIDEQHHLHLLLWVKHLAYGNQDIDVFDRRKSDDFEGKFRAYCARAKAEQVRARRQTGAVQYGGH
jgi:hypothetical protein